MATIEIPRERLAKLGRKPTDADLRLERMRQRADARALKRVPIQPEERLQVFDQFGWRMHGLYVPSDVEMRTLLQIRVRDLGGIPNEDERLVRYFALQDQSAEWERDGIEGAWTGQQAVARSSAQFRLAGWGRRGGKSLHAAREAICCAVKRPRSTIWIAAPTHKLVSRVFDMVLALVRDLNLDVKRIRNGVGEKLIEFGTDAVIEGISLEKEVSAAGASVNLVIVDEAASVHNIAWVRSIQPPLTDANGQALLISSYQGESGFFFEQAERAQRDHDESWAIFHGESWQNFFSFPQGKETPSLVTAKRGMDPIDFLEQFGAIPARGRLLVYPQFKKSVHVGEFPYNPKWPVTLSVDPSGGANPYAVSVLQDDPAGDVSYQIDEVYQQGAITRDILQIVRRRPWINGVTEVLVDPADQTALREWVLAGFNAYGVPNKPLVEERYPVYRRLLRDPERYAPYWEQKLNGLLADYGLTREEYESYPVDRQLAYLTDLEESLAERNLTAEDVKILRMCAHIFIDFHCFFTIEEHLHYQYAAPRRGDRSPNERGRKFKDHILDANGYWAWTNRFRFEEVKEQTDRSYINPVAQQRVSVPFHRLDGPSTEQAAGLDPRGFLYQCRSATRPTSDSYSLLRRSD